MTSAGGCLGSGFSTEFRAFTAACLPSWCGIFVYRDDTSMDARMHLSGSGLFSISRINSVVSFINEGRKFPETAKNVSENTHVRKRFLFFYSVLLHCQSSDRPFIAACAVVRQCSAYMSALSAKVLVKCRQNVANKLFITRVFNPVHPHTCNKLTALALSALLTTQSIERSYVSKRGWGKLFLSVEVQNLHKSTVVVDVGPAGSGISSK